MEKITEANINNLKRNSWHSREVIAEIKLTNSKTETNYFITDYHSDHSVTAFVDSTNQSSFERIPIETIEQDNDISRDLMFKPTSLKELNLIEPSGFEEMFKHIFQKQDEVREVESLDSDLPTNKEMEEFNKELPDFDIDR